MSEREGFYTGASVHRLRMGYTRVLLEGERLMKCGGRGPWVGLFAAHLSLVVPLVV